VTERNRTQADQDNIDQMKSNLKIIAVKLTKTAMLVGAGYFVYKKIKTDLNTKPENETTTEN
jgi:hypothetical protein